MYRKTCRFFIFILFLSRFSCFICIPYPVIFVPGDGGSQLEAKINKSEAVHYVCDKVTNDYFSLWLNLELLVPVVVDCLIDNMRLVYDNVTRTTHNSPGVEIRIPNFGNSSVIEYIDPSKISAGGYFNKIVDMLIPLGYTRDVSVRGAPYDFRKAPNENGEYFIQIKNLIEETYALNGNKPVVLVAHSMGGLMCFEFMHRQTQSWKDKYIRALVTLAGVWGGSVKAIKVFAVGDDLGVYVLKGKTLRAEQITSPSLAWLLPSPLFWKSDEVFVQTDKKNYTLNNLKDYFTDIDFMTGWYMRQDVEKYSLDFRAPGVELYCLHGYGVETVERLVYKTGAFPNGSPTVLTGDGDGTVNRRSLEGCLRFQSQQKEKVYYQPFPVVNHMNILLDKNVLTYLTQLFKSFK